MYLLADADILSFGCQVPISKEDSPRSKKSLWTVRQTDGWMDYNKKSMGTRKKSYREDPPSDYPKKYKENIKPTIFLYDPIYIFCPKAKKSVYGKRETNKILYLGLQRIDS